MTRDEAHSKVKEWMREETDKGQFWHYGRIELHRDIDRIFDSLQNENKLLSKTSMEENDSVQIWYDDMRYKEQKNKD